MEKRTEQEMMNIILSIANQDERIRIVTIEGSRTNINIPKDEFQDMILHILCGYGIVYIE